MDKKTKQLIIGGIILAVLISVASAFLASSDPDGFEKAAENLVPDFEDAAVIESPMPDYIIPHLGENPISTAIAIIIGVMIVFILAYGLGYLSKRKEKKE